MRVKYSLASTVRRLELQDAHFDPIYEAGQPTHPYDLRPGDEITWRDEGWILDEIESVHADPAGIQTRWNLKAHAPRKPQPV